jgi:hypothetical protein
MSALLWPRHDFQVSLSERTFLRNLLINTSCCCTKYTSDRDPVRPIKSVMHSKMTVNYLVFVALTGKTKTIYMYCLRNVRK